MPPAQRRQHARHTLNRPVKLRCDGSAGRYLAGHTHDISAGGASLRVEGSARLAAGERVRLGIADHRAQAVLSEHAMVGATVVRSLGHGGVWHVAVRFDQPVTLALAG